MSLEIEPAGPRITIGMGRFEAVWLAGVFRQLELNYLAKADLIAMPDDQKPFIEEAQRFEALAKAFYTAVKGGTHEHCSVLRRP